MRITDIKHSGFNTLYNAQFIEYGGRTLEFGQNIDKLLNHCKIDISITEISPIEMIALNSMGAVTTIKSKRCINPIDNNFLSSRLSSINESIDKINNNINDTIVKQDNILTRIEILGEGPKTLEERDFLQNEADILEDKIKNMKSVRDDNIKQKDVLSKVYDSDMVNDLKSLEGLVNEISSDNDISNIDIYSLVPLGFISYDIGATFVGKAILNISGVRINDILRDSDNTNHTIDDSIRNNIYSHFVNNLYRTMNGYLDKVDLLSDSIIMKNFYDFANEQQNVAISHVDYFGGSMEFFNASKNKLIQEVKKFKNIMIDNPNSEFYSIFTLSTSMSYFLKMMVEEKIVIDHMDLNILLNESTLKIDDNIIEKYKNRLTELYDRILEKRKLLCSSGITDLNKYLLIFGGQKIKYNIRFSDHKDDIFEKYTDDESTYIYSLICNSLNIIRSR